MNDNHLIYTGTPVTETPLPVQAATTNDLDCQYGAVQRRLERFREVPREAAQRAWDMLLMWSRQVHDSGGSLPAPRVFGNEEGVVEFEWHLPTRQLFIALDAPNSANVIRLDQTSGTETETEFLSDTSEIAKHLLWVLGRGT